MLAFWIRQFHNMNREKCSCKHWLASYPSSLSQRTFCKVGDGVALFERSGTLCSHLANENVRLPLIHTLPRPTVIGSSLAPSEQAVEAGAAQRFPVGSVRVVLAFAAQHLCPQLFSVLAVGPEAPVSSMYHTLGLRLTLLLALWQWSIIFA